MKKTQSAIEKKQNQYKRRKNRSNTIVKSKNDGRVRLLANKSNVYTYAYLIKPNGDVLCEVNDKNSDYDGAKVERATKVGEQIAKKAKDLGIEKVCFDRNGFQYHGRIKALAQWARDWWLDF